MLAIAIGAMALVIAHLATLHVPDLPADQRKEAAAGTAGVDIRGTVHAIRLVPGLFGLILFHTFNNFLGGIFMALMDAYGLLLVSVQAWGILWGLLSLGFIVGGMVVATRGLGKNPLRMLLLANTAMWAICIVFPLQASVLLLAVGMFVWLCLIPVVEAAEQTVLQKVVEPERQGRVFGFAQSVEQAATPITAFLIGPIAQAIFIPFMTTGDGATLLGPWFGIGADRGIGLLFIVAGWIGLIVTLLAMRSNSYRVLSADYQEPELVPVPSG
jgi:DHA3 family multidrug efflux protein-like MFS transporter